MMEKFKLSDGEHAMITCGGCGGVDKFIHTFRHLWKTIQQFGSKIRLEAGLWST